MAEIKQTNFRIDQETADAFRKFCEEMGMNQAQGFDHIMQVVETDRAKTIMPERRTEIESFEKALKDIHEGYLYSLEINKNAEDRIREQFISSIKRNEKTIDDLREKIEKLQDQNAAIESLRVEAEKEADAAKERAFVAASQREAAKKAAADQEQINALLTKQLEEATAKLEGYDALRDSEAALKEEVADLKYAVKEAETTLSHAKEMYEAKLEEAKKVAEKCAALEASEAALKENVMLLERNVEDERKASENALKQAQAAAELALERAVIEKEREMNAQIRQADKENARLAARIEQLEARIAELGTQNKKENR